MRFLDKDNSGTIDMSEFLVGVRVKIEYFIILYFKGITKQKKIDDN